MVPHSPTNRQNPAKQPPTNPPRPLGFNPEKVNLYPICWWSPDRPLARNGHQVVYTKERFNHWELFDKDTWLSLVSDFHEKRGPICSLHSFETISGGFTQGDVFRLVMSVCDYSEHLATVAYLETHQGTHTRISRMAAQRNFTKIAQTTPPSSVKVCVCVVSPNATVLAVRRSNDVDMKRGEWTLGVNETMCSPDVTLPHGEDLFGLCQRALFEEVGLSREDYGDISISWMGYSSVTLQVKLWAHVRTHLPETIVCEKMGMAHSTYEAEEWEWLPFRKNILQELTHNWRPDARGRMWSDSTPLSAQELWRMRNNF